MHVSDTLRFLLPADGLLYAARISEDRRGAKHDTRLGIEAFVTLAESLYNSGDHVYMAVAAYRPDTEGRKGENVKSLKSVVFDIDLDPTGTKNGAPCYTNKTDAYAAFIRLAQTVSLPPPSVVIDSGRGLHLYWTAPAAVEPHVWYAVARKIKAVFLRDPLLSVDASVVDNQASLIRLPCSINHKSGTRVFHWQYAPGKIVSTFKTYDFEALAAQIHIDTDGVDAAPLSVAPQSQTLPISAPTRTPALTTINSCALVRSAITDNTRFGNHQYVALASVLASDPNPAMAVDVINAIMRPGPGFDAAETRRFVQRTHAEGRQPARCDVLRQRFPHLAGSCGACPMFRFCAVHGEPLSSPALAVDYAGWTEPQPAPVAAPAAQVSGASGAMAEIAGAAQAAAGDALGVWSPEGPDLRLPARLVPQSPPVAGVVSFPNCDMLRVDVTITPGEPAEVEYTTVLRDFTLWVDSTVSTTASSTEGADSESMVRLGIARFNTHLSTREVRSVDIPASHLAAPQTLFTSLAKVGVHVAGDGPRRAVMRYLADEANASHNRMSETLGASALGWVTPHGGEVSDTNAPRDFCVAGVRLSSDPARRVTPMRYIGDAKTILSKSALSQTPTALDSARYVLRTYATRGSDPAKLTLLASLSSPLISATDVNGAIFGLTGSTGLGKTALLDLASSVWGFEQSALRVNDTFNGINSVLSALKHVPGTLDEITKMESEAFSDLVYSCTEGQSKQRLDSSARLRAVSVRRSVLITTSNEDLYGKTGRDGAVGDALRARIWSMALEEVAISDLSRGEAQDLTAAVRDSRGWIGLAFARHIVDNWSQVRARIKEVSRLMPSDSELRFVNALASCMVVANECLAQIFPEWTLGGQELASIIDKARGSHRTRTDDLKVDPVLWVRSYVQNTASQSVTVEATSAGPRMVGAPERGAPAARVELPMTAAEPIVVYIPADALREYCARRSMIYSDVLAVIHSDSAARVAGLFDPDHKQVTVELFKDAVMSAGEPRGGGTIRGGLGRTTCFRFTLPNERPQPTALALPEASNVTPFAKRS